MKRLFLLSIIAGFVIPSFGISNSVTGVVNGKSYKIKKWTPTVTVRDAQKREVSDTQLLIFEGNTYAYCKYEYTEGRSQDCAGVCMINPYIPHTEEQGGFICLNDIRIQHDMDNLEDSVVSLFISVYESENGGSYTTYSFYPSTLREQLMENGIPIDENDTSSGYWFKNGTEPVSDPSTVLLPLASGYWVSYDGSLPSLL